MSRTYRKQPTYIFRGVRTANELRQVRVSNDFYDDEYTVSIRHRYIPTNYDDIRVSAYQQLDHHQ
jgi:uroporphyrinogen-III synthase